MRLPGGSKPRLFRPSGAPEAVRTLTGFQCDHLDARNPRFSRPNDGKHPGPDELRFLYRFEGSSVALGRLSVALGGSSVALGVRRRRFALEHPPSDWPQSPDAHRGLRVEGRVRPTKQPPSRVRAILQRLRGDLQVERIAASPLQLRRPPPGAGCPAPSRDRRGPRQWTRLDDLISQEGLQRQRIAARVSAFLHFSTRRSPATPAPPRAGPAAR